jgi:hypothetical protein
LDKFFDGMTVLALGVGTGQAIHDYGLGMFKIRQTQDSLGFLAIDSGAQLLPKQTKRL